MNTKTMQVKMLESVAGVDEALSAGQIVDLPCKRARNYIRMGWAQQHKPERAVPKKPKLEIPEREEPLVE